MNSLLQLYLEYINNKRGKDEFTFVTVFGVL